MGQFRDRQWIEELKRRADIVDVAGWLGLAPRPRGRVFVSRCLTPERHRHGDRKAEHLVLDPQRGTYGCYACGYWGDVIGLVQAVLGVGFREAVRLLAERYNVATPWGQARSTLQRPDAKSRGPAPKAGGDRRASYQPAAGAVAQAGDGPEVDKGAVDALVRGYGASATSEEGAAGDGLAASEAARVDGPGGLGHMRRAGEVEGEGAAGRAGVKESQRCNAATPSAPQLTTDAPGGGTSDLQGAKVQGAPGAAVERLRSPTDQMATGDRGAAGVGERARLPAGHGAGRGNEGSGAAVAGDLPASGMAAEARPERALEDGSAEVYEWLLERCPLGEEALEYLERRGIRADTAYAARLGWVQNPAAVERMLRQAFDAETLQRAGVVTSSGYFVFTRHRLIWPFFWPALPEVGEKAGEADGAGRTWPPWLGKRRPRRDNVLTSESGNVTAPGAADQLALFADQTGTWASCGDRGEDGRAAGVQAERVGDFGGGRLHAAGRDAPTSSRCNATTPERASRDAAAGQVHAEEGAWPVRPVYLLAEAVDEHTRKQGPKRLNLARPVPCPYMVHLLAFTEPGEPVIVCEGPVDTLLAVQAGYTALGLPGAGVFRPQWAMWLVPFEVYLALDADAAGRWGARRIARELWRVGKRCKVLPLPDERDLAEWLAG